MASGDFPARVTRLSAGRLMLLGIAALAFCVRLLPVALGGGLGSYGRYDDGVYYAAADALTFGRVPYRDFVLLHPPGIALVLAPFALLGRLTSDATGMAVARLAFMGIGACNAVLVVVLARRWGRTAAVVAGVLYACWSPAVYGEQTTLLEPLGTAALLVGLLLLLKTPRRSAAAAEAVAGVVLGLAVAMKIWYVVPWAVIAGWLLVSGRRSAAWRVLATGAAALLIVVTPFAILARGRMFDMVVRDQLFRHPTPTSRLGRLSSIFGIKAVVPHPSAAVLLLTAVVVVVFTAAAIVCWRDRRARVLVVLLVANLAVLLLAPTYFAHYGELTAAPAALVLGVAAGKVAARGLPRPVPAIAVSLILVSCLISGVRVAGTPEGQIFPGDQLADAAPAGCVASDEPQALIQMDRLSPDLSAGCRVPVDVTGITYDTLRRYGLQGQAILRHNNVAWQQYLYDFLVSARSFVVARPQGDSIAPSTSSRLVLHPVLAHADGVKLRLGGLAP